MTDYPCDECGKPFKRTDTQVKRGRRFCCWDCYLLGRQKEFEKLHASRKCASDDCARTDVVARGLCNACYQQWNIRFGRNARWMTKKCPTCGIEFPTHTDRTYCTLECYVASDVFKKARQRYSEQAAKARELRKCLDCGADISLTACQTVPQKYADGVARSPKLFCGKRCYRNWFALRFDRFVAEYTKLEMPMTYDEFLNQTELPCLIEGCTWMGKNLSIHCNHVHGITADELKALAGFNRTTGVIGRETRSILSNRKSGRQAGSEDIKDFMDAEALSKPRGPMRPEGREHHRKSAAIRKPIQETPFTTTGDNQ